MIELREPLWLHIKTMVRWLNDPEVVRYSEQRHLTHTDETQLKYLANLLREGNEIRAIFAENKFIGSITAYIDSNNSVANVGILIGEKSEWGKGYGYEAWAAFCDHLLNNGIRKIEAGCMSGNLGMVRIFRKYRMVLEGFRDDHFLISPEETRHMQLWGRLSETV